MAQYSQKRLASLYKLAVKSVLALLAAAYLVTATHVIVPSLEYWLNQEYIAEVLCENADHPELGCNGKCHMAKMMGEAGHSHADESQQIVIKRPLDIRIIKTQSYHAVSVIDSGKTTYHTAVYFPATKLFVSDIFHPPEAQSTS